MKMTDSKLTRMGNESLLCPLNGNKIKNNQEQEQACIIQN